MAANAVELTVEQAWYLAERTGSGSFPWVLAITAPYSDSAAADGFAADRVAELTELGVLSGDGAVNPPLSPSGSEYAAGPGSGLRSGWSALRATCCAAWWAAKASEPSSRCAAQGW